MGLTNFRKTRKLDLPYYTQNVGFTRNEIYKIEQEIYQIYFSQTNKKCQREQSELARLKYLSRRTSDKAQKDLILKRILKQELPNCKLFQKLRATLGI